MAKDQGSPACSTEERPWEAGDLEMVPRSRRAKIAGSYVATVTPRIGDEPSIDLPGRLAARVAEAEAAIARFDEDAAFRSLDNSTRLAQDLAAVRDSWTETISARADSTV